MPYAVLLLRRAVRSHLKITFERRWPYRASCMRTQFVFVALHNFARHLFYMQFQPSIYTTRSLLFSCLFSEFSTRCLFVTMATADLYEFAAFLLLPNCFSNVSTILIETSVSQPSWLQQPIPQTRRFDVIKSEQQCVYEKFLPKQKSN